MEIVLWYFIIMRVVCMPAWVIKAVDTKYLQWEFKVNMKILMINYLKENADKEVFLELNLPVLAIVQVLAMDSKEET